MRLVQFRTQHELARNFYDDQEFCPIYHIEEVKKIFVKKFDLLHLLIINKKVTEHRERIQKRNSPCSSPSSHSPQPSSYYVSSSPKQQHQQQARHPHHHHYQPQVPSSTPPITTTTTTTTTRAIPIIDPSNMTPVSVPSSSSSKPASNNSTSPSMVQCIAYKNSNNSSGNTSPTSSNSSISSMSSSSSDSYNYATSNYGTYYYSNSTTAACAINYNRQSTHYQPTMPIVARAIPIIDPTTRQVYRQPQQQTIPPPGFYNVSVC